MKKLLADFDALFNLSNLCLAGVCLGLLFEFDERFVMFIFVEIPMCSLPTILGDACPDEFEVSVAVAVRTSV